LNFKKPDLTGDGIWDRAVGQKNRVEIGGRLGNFPFGNIAKGRFCAKGIYGRDCKPVF
jgi:hypothetical protein